MPAVSKAVWASMLTAALMLFLGCQPKPKAPALLDEPVYQSDEGFRFLVPEGWIMIARGNAPPRPIEKECLLVQYRRDVGDTPATLEVSLMDLPEDADLTTYLSKPSFAARQWKPVGKAELVEAEGARGTRYRFSASIDGTEFAKEVTAFRRGDRVYFFGVLYAPKDATAPEQVRRSISRLEWTR